MNTAPEIRQRLEARQAELTERLRRIQRDRLHTDAAVSQKFSEQAVQRENDEVLGGLEASTKSDLRQVRHALQRLAAGHYGECEACGFGIEGARLAALPHATLCGSCANRAATAA